MSMIAMTIMRRKNMISVKELRIGNLVKDKDGNIWRIGCITGRY